MSTTIHGCFQQIYARYQERGLQIVPIKQGTKKPAVEQWTRWSTEIQSIDMLDQWAKDFNDCGVGLVCGPSSNIVGLDLDLNLEDPDDRKIFDAIEPLIPKTPLIKRGAKGFTYFYRYDCQVSRSLKSNGRHVGDLLSIGRQTVLPPSIHPNGNPYVWIGDDSILDVDLTALPSLTVNSLAAIDLELSRYGCPSQSKKKMTGRNETLKAQVVAAYFKNKPLDEIVSEVIKFDMLNHSPPLFSDPEEYQRWNLPTENARHFAWSITKSLPKSNIQGAESKTRMERSPKIIFPRLDESAFYGLAGRIVKELAPFTEADLGAVLVQLLVITIQVVGRTSYWKVGGTYHYLNQFIIIMGETAFARKGTGLGLVTSLIQEVDPNFVKFNMPTGLSSGEGLIANLRDPTDEEVAESGKESFITRLADKRRVFAEEEFVNVLKVLKRENNTLSGILRNMWDCKSLQIIVKNNPMTATDPMCSIIGHCTPKEFKTHIQANDITNGLLNRFLFLYSTHSKLLPLPPPIPNQLMEGFSNELKSVIDFAKGVGEMGFTDDAAQLWSSIYEGAHSGDESEDVSAITARNLPILRRLACVYALFDKREVVDCVHLVAASAVIDYSTATCRMLMTEKSPSRDQIKIMTALADLREGLTKTELIHDVFKRNTKIERINKAISELENDNQIVLIGDNPQRWRLSSEEQVENQGHDYTTSTTQVEEEA